MKRLSKIVILAASLLITGALWAETHTMQATSINPGARGTVEVKPEKDSNNSKVTIKVEHLPRPSLLSPQAERYVVWVQPEGQEAQNEGTLNVDNNQKGNMEFTTTATRFVVLVTAENEPNPQQPSNRVVLRSDIQG